MVKADKCPRCGGRIFLTLSKMWWCPRCGWRKEDEKRVKEE